MAGAFACNVFHPSRRFSTQRLLFCWYAGKLPLFLLYLLPFCKLAAKKESVWGKSPFRLPCSVLCCSGKPCLLFHGAVSCSHPSRPLSLAPESSSTYSSKQPCRLAPKLKLYNQVRQAFLLTGTHKPWPPAPPQPGSPLQLPCSLGCLLCCSLVLLTLARWLLFEWFCLRQNQLLSFPYAQSFLVKFTINFLSSFVQTMLFLLVMFIKQREIT